jgi:chromosomal replication initiator protein
LSRAKVVRRSSPEGHSGSAPGTSNGTSRRHDRDETNARERSASSGLTPSNSTPGRVLAQRIVKARPAGEQTIPHDAPARFEVALRDQLGPDRFERYAEGRLRLVFSPNELRVTASSGALADLLKRRFMTELHQSAERALGRGIAIRIDFTETPGASDGIGETARAASMRPGSVGASGDGAVPGRGAGAGEAERTSPVQVRAGLVERIDAGRADPAVRSSRAGGINPRYRLEDFIVGESNRLAYNAALALAEERPGAGEAGGAGGLGGVGGAGAYSLLFIHGPCGVGKSHLAHGVAMRFRERHPGASVRVTGGEAFMNEFVAAIRDGSAGGSNGGSSSGMDKFRRNYRRVDLLVIDDVQALANKQATQAELLHTFEEIARSGARVVLVSDQHPRQLEKFSPQLISRFLAGMVAGIAPPDEDLTRRLIKTLALRRGLAMDEQAVAATAQRARLLPGAASGLSVREIEGILTRIEAVHRLLPDPSGASRSGAINLLAIERALGNGSSVAGVVAGAPTAAAGNGVMPEHALGVAASMLPGGGRGARIETIITQTCRYLSVDPMDLSGRTRHKRVVLARSVITHLARQFTTMSFPEIARALGRPNHSTVITAYQRLAAQLAENEQLGHEHVPEPMTVNALVDRLTTTLKGA